MQIRKQALAVRAKVKSLDAEEAANNDESLFECDSEGDSDDEEDDSDDEDA